MPNSTVRNLPRTAVKIANIVFASGVVISVLVSAYAAYRIFAPISAIYLDDGLVAFLIGDQEWINPVRNFYVIFISAGILSAILFGLGLRLKENVKVNLSLLFIATGITIYGVETYLEFSGAMQLQSVIDKESIHLFSDKRTQAEVISDLAKNSIEAYPNINPTWELLDESTKEGLTTKKGKIFVLSGISNKMMVQANENGYWMMYVGDRYGFHNPDNVYDVDMVDIVMTGDSFTEGWAVRSDENISAILRTFGWNVINLGKAGNGPLLEYAAIKEYAEILKPKIVLWLYWPNDIENDLVFELKSDLLRRYLNEDEFSQNLLSRQSEIDNSLIQFVEGTLAEQVVSQALIEERTRLSEQQLEIVHRKEFASKSMVKILKLRNLRKMVDLVPEPAAETNPELAEPALPGQSPGQTNETYLKAVFMQTLEKANQLISSWNGGLYFVYLPSVRTITDDEEHPWRQFSLNTATELGIPIIDIENKVFAPHDDPASLFPLRNSGYHYNAKGYRLLAEAIAERLKADGVLQ